MTKTHPHLLAQALLLSACAMTPASGPTVAANPAGKAGSPDAPTEQPAPAKDELLPLPDARSLIEEEGFRGTLVVRRAGERTMYATGPQRARQPYLPASTFKIPNALFALQAGVADCARFSLSWDGERRTIESWNRDHDLRSAMEHSVVWYFRGIARRIGQPRMQRFIRDIGYGNERIGDRVDLFRLEGPLAITAEEQVEFMERFVSGDLPFAPEHIRTVRDIVPSRTVGRDTIHAKTGTAIRTESGHGWLVGWTERDGTPTSCFALLLLGDPDDGVERIVQHRWDLAIRLLEATGVIAGVTVLDAR